MWLDEWLFKRRMKANAFAKMLDITPQYLYDIISGRRICGPKVARKIIELTEGEITEHDIFHGPKRLPEKNKKFPRK